MNFLNSLNFTSMWCSFLDYKFSEVFPKHLFRTKNGKAVLLIIIKAERHRSYFFSLNPNKCFPRHNFNVIENENIFNFTYNINLQMNIIFFCFLSLPLVSFQLRFDFTNFEAGGGISQAHPNHVKSNSPIGGVGTLNDHHLSASAWSGKSWICYVQSEFRRVQKAW